MKIHYITALLFTYAITFISCSKTEYEQEMRPYTAIESFYLEEASSGKERLEGVISADSIIVYWNPDVTLPAEITPTIVVAKGATISPASGASVPFSETTTYTVTAENGDSKTYQLKIKTQRETPILTAVVAAFSNPVPVEQLYWKATAVSQATSGQYLNLLGEYFFATGDAADVKVYMQRLHDGYEFDLPIVANTGTNTSMQVELPKFSTQQDTGRHRIWVQVGGLASESKDIFLRSPSIQTTGIGTADVDLVEAGADVRAGQTLHINYNYTDVLDGAITRYYDPKDFYAVVLSARVVTKIDTTINPRTGLERYTYTYKNGSFLVTDHEVTSDKIQVTLPAEVEEYVGGTITSAVLVYKYINQEGVWAFLSGNSVMTYGHTVSLPYGFTVGPHPVTGVSRQTTIVSAGSN